MAHTPGPWRIRETFTPEYIEDETNSNLIAIIDWQFNEEETQSNASLIAAAPELLAALNKVLMYWETIELPREVYAQITAVIAKAKSA